jgi:phage-related protein
LFFRERRGRRKIVAECFIEADSFTDRRDAVTALADWLDVEAEAVLRISDAPGVFYRGVAMAFPSVEEWRNLAKFDLEWSVQAFAFDDDLTTETWTSDGSSVHTWNPNLKKHLYPVIEITPNNGTIESFDLDTNGATLSFVGLIPDDTMIVVNSIAPTVTTGPNTDTELVGAYNPASVFLLGVTGQFPELIPGGTNSITLDVTSGTATNITVSVIYRQLYRS